MMKWTLCGMTTVVAKLWLSSPSQQHWQTDGCDGGPDWLRLGFQQVWHRTDQAIGSLTPGRKLVSFNYCHYGRTVRTNQKRGSLRPEGTLVGPDCYHYGRTLKASQHLSVLVITAWYRLVLTLEPPYKATSYSRHVQKMSKTMQRKQNIRMSWLWEKMTRERKNVTTSGSMKIFGIT